MFKLTRAVGKNCYSATTADIEMVQIALSNIKNKKFKPYYSGKIDGKKSSDLEAAIIAFQVDQGLPATGKIDAGGACVSRIRSKTPARLFASAGQVAPGSSAPAPSAASVQATLVKKHLMAGKVGWVNDLEGAFAPGKAILVQANTGKLVVDANGDVISGPKLTISSMPITFQDAYNFVLPHEARIEHMYLDTKGLVTVGVGYNLDAFGGVAAALALPFVYKSNNQLASAADIMMDYQEVAKDSATQISATKNQKRTAGSYDKDTKLKLLDVDIDALSNSIITTFIQETTTKLLNSNDSELPLVAKLVAFDLVYNVGLPKAQGYLCTLAALRRRDWDAAGVEQGTGRDQNRALKISKHVKKLKSKPHFFISLKAKGTKKSNGCTNSVQTNVTIPLSQIS